MNGLALANSDPEALVGNKGVKYRGK